MSLSKKIFIISSVLFATILFFMGIYNISFKEKVSAPNLTSQETNNNGQNNTIQKVEDKLGISNNKEKIYPLSSEAVIAPAITDGGEKIIFYTKSNGSVYKVSLNGEGKELVDNNNFSGLENILWSPDRSKVLSRFNSNGKIEYSTYDYKTKKSSVLSGGITWAIWNNLGDGIIYKYLDPKTNKATLNTSNPDGSNWKKIADISINNARMAAVPQSSFVSFWNSPNSFENTIFNLVGAVGGDSKKIFSGRFGADYLWSPNGAKALVSFSDSKGGSKMNLAVINSNGGEFQNLNIPTFVSKCAWSKDSKIIYYALPSISSAGAVLPNDYLDKKTTSKDTFWKMDVATGKAERIVNIEDIKNSYDASNLFLSPGEDLLFFVNNLDGKLYRITL